MVWNNEIVEVLEHEISAYSIFLRCRLKGKVEEWVFSGVYGPCLPSEVIDFLGELDNIRGRWDLPWCSRGDFNLVRFPSERKEDRRWDFQMIQFGEFIDRWV